MNTEKMRAQNRDLHRAVLIGAPGAHRTNSFPRAVHWLINRYRKVRNERDYYRTLLMKYQRHVDHWATGWHFFSGDDYNRITVCDSGDRFQTIAEEFSKREWEELNRIADRGWPEIIENNLALPAQPTQRVINILEDLGQPWGKE